MHGQIMPPLDQWEKWPPPNFDNPPTQPKYVLVAACILGPISVSLVVARLWVRVRLQRNAGLDDWLMLASLVPMIALTVIFPLIVERYYFNRHIWDIEYKYYPLQRKFLMAIYCLYIYASGLIKLSVLLFYRRLAKGLVSRPFQCFMIITLVMITVYTIAFSLVPIFICRPISAFWNQVDINKILQPGYKYTCINEGADVVANGIASTIMDFIVVILPTLLCWNLQIPLRQKIALYCIFAISYSTVALGAMRTYTSYRIFFETYDVTWVSSQAFLWSLLELHIGSMCANVPALKVFYNRLLKPELPSNWLASKTRSNTSTERQNSALSRAPCVPVTPLSPAWDKPLSWTRTGSHNSRGYLPEPHEQTGTDKHGSILHMKTHLVSGRKRDSMIRSSTPEYADTIIPARYGRADIEMGNVWTSNTEEMGKSEEEDDELQALPKFIAPKRRSFLLPPVRAISPFSGR